MKGYITIITFTVIIITANIDVICPRDHGRDFGDVLEEEMNICPLVNCTDSFFGFQAPYPALFIPERSVSDSIIGCYRFCYNNIVDITIDCYVCRNIGCDDTDGGLSRLAQTMKGRVISDADGNFIYGPAVDGDCYRDGYSRFTKCVAKDKLWCIYSLTFPDKYAERLRRLFAVVRQWKPWRGTS